MLKKMNDPNKKNREFAHIGQIINSLLSNYQKKNASSVGRLTQIGELWPAVAGRAIADNTKPTGMKGGLLFVNVTSSVWMQQLQFVKEELIARLNTELGDNIIQNIKFKIGQI